MNKILLQGSITLAQVFVTNMNYYNHQIKENIGENIIRYIYKWFGKDIDEVEYAVNEFKRHNDNCKFECYCCGQCEGCNNFPDNEPNINDEYIKNIDHLLCDMRNDNNLGNINYDELKELFGQ